MNLPSTPWWIILIWVFPSRCSKQTFFIVWESESISNARPSYRFPKGKHHIKQAIHFFFNFSKLVFIHLFEMFSLLLYKYIMCSAWFSLWYLLSINCLLIFGYVYTALHEQKLQTLDLKKFYTVTVLSWWQNTTTRILSVPSFKKMYLKAVVTGRVKSNQVMMSINYSGKKFGMWDEGCSCRKDGLE